MRLEKLNSHHLKIVSDFLVESVEILERMANPAKPPLDVKALAALESALVEGQKSDDIDNKLAAMSKAFRRRGDPSAWDDETVLAEIDKCFTDNFLLEGEIRDELFYGDDPETHDLFTKYRSDVDKVLKDHRSSKLPYAREYFAYSMMMWKKRGYKFPVPLGTASVIECIHNLVKKHSAGLTEVRLSPDFGHCMFPLSTTRDAVTHVPRVYAAHYTRGHICVSAYA